MNTAASEPTIEEAKLYMEICGALMRHFGVSEVELGSDDAIMTPFQIWRRIENGKMTVRLIIDARQ